MFANFVNVEDGLLGTIGPWLGVPLTAGSFQSGMNFGDTGDRYLEGHFFGPNA